MRLFEAETYRLAFPDDRPFVYLDSPAGDRLAELFMLSAVHPLNGRDDTLRIGAWQVHEEAGETVFSLHAESLAWEHKLIRLRCSARRLRYEVEVHGRGQLAEVDFFGGYYSGHVRWGSGYFWSGQSFLRGFNPEPTSHEEYTFSPAGGALIDLMGVPLPGKASWFFTPPPFCFAMEHRGGWLGLGIEARAGENRFTEYSYHGLPSAFHLRLAYDGHTTINGQYALPAVGFDFAADPYQALAAHAGVLRASGLTPIPPPVAKPGWWQMPIFCGWGSQCGIAARENGRAPDYARQPLYEEFLQVLEANDLRPGIVVLDDKWQASYGENRVDEQKWPDLRGFVHRQHAAGRKVLFWLKAWDADGLPVDECITNAAGMAVAFDPTNPAFARRLRESVRRMLSSDGYDADGFKIDFTARIPAGPGMRTHGDVWGLELMKTYLKILHDEAKQVKPDALIMAHTPHPYLADVVDMIRLNDINTGRPVNPAMSHRAQVAVLACPEAVIDTDNWPIPDKMSWRNYVQLQPDLGVPSLYFATHIDSTGEPLDAEDYRLVREVWKRWLAQREGGA